jgi:hypothetical protein
VKAKVKREKTKLQEKRTPGGRGSRFL